MPNIKSAKKRLGISVRQNLRNTAAKSAIKTSVKRFESALANGEKEQAQTAFKSTVKTLDKAVSKGLLHKNTAARKKSRLSKNLNDLIS